MREIDINDIDKELSGYKLSHKINCDSDLVLSNSALWVFNRSFDNGLDDTRLFWVDETSGRVYIDDL